MRNAPQYAAAATLTVLLLSSCASVASPPTDQPSTTAHVSSAASTATPEDAASPPPLGSDPQWEAEDQESARATARAGLDLYLRPSIAQADWFTELAPHLSATAQQVYVTVPNDQIPATARQDDCQLAESETAFLAIAACATSAGAYTLLMQREDGDSSWQIARFTPPENAQ